MELSVGGRERCRDPLFLDLEVTKTSTELLSRQRAVRGQIDETFFLDLQLLEFLGKSGLLLLLRSEHMVESRGHIAARFEEFLCGESQGSKFAHDGLLDSVGGEVREFAHTVLPSTAEVVLVQVAGMVLCFGEDEAVLASSIETAAAVQHAAQEVIVDAVPLSPLHPRVDHLLHAGEEFRGDERFMATGIELAFEGDHADVVRVTEDLAELAARQRSLRPLGGLAGGEALLGEFIRQARCAVLAGRVLLEGPLDQRGTLFVDADGVHESSVELLANVLVAELGAASGAAVLRLVEKLVLDVFTALAHLHLVENVEDGFHRVAQVPLAEVLFCGHESNAHRGEDALGDRCVPLIPEDSRAHVDDDVADFGMLLDVAQHLSEDGPLRDGLSRVPGFHELACDRRLGSLGAFDAQCPLGCDGVAIRIDVDGGIHLPRRGDAQVQDSLAAGALRILQCGRRRPVESE